MVFLDHGIVVGEGLPSALLGGGAPVRILEFLCKMRPRPAVKRF